jgi:hypothetical protein
VNGYGVTAFGENCSRHAEGWRRDYSRFVDIARAACTYRRLLLARDRDRNRRKAYERASDAAYALVRRLSK